MLKAWSLYLAAAVGAAALSPFIAASTAHAASRTTCLCDGKEKGRLHHRFACEYHFKRPGNWPAGGGPVPKGGCTKQEWVQFKTFLCVKDGCTYRYIRYSPTVVPLDAD